MGGRDPSCLPQIRKGNPSCLPNVWFIFWLRDESLEDSANLPEPDVLAAEIVEDLRSALAQLEGIAEELGEEE